MTHSEKFRLHVSDVRARVLELQGHAIQTPPIPELLDELMLDVANMLAELDTAEDELRQQDETLDETRDALVREQQRYRQLFEFAPDAYIVTDLYGSIHRANLAAVQLLNLEEKFLIHKPLAVFVVDDQRTHFREAVTHLRDAGRASTLELRLYPRHQANPVSVLATMNLIYDPDGSPTSIHWAFVDITTQKRLEAELRQLNAALERRVQERTEHLEAANQEKDELLLQAQAARAEAERANALKMKLLATISHELRTPLTSIKGFSSTLLATDVDWDAERWQSFVTIIDEEASKLAELVEQLLDSSRLQAGALRIRKEPSTLENVVKEALKQLSPHLDGHRLTVDLPPNLPALSLDRSRIAQVMVNLVGNSVKYSPKGTTIVLAARLQPNSVEVCVSDEGQGIPPVEREQVFEPFYQTEEGVRKRSGTGLGLAICKGLVERHGGSIWIADREPPGTTICFTLPLVQ